MSNYNLPPGCTLADIDRAATPVYEHWCTQCDAGVSDPVWINGEPYCKHCIRQCSACSAVVVRGSEFDSGWGYDGDWYCDKCKGELQ